MSGRHGPSAARCRGEGQVGSAARRANGTAGRVAPWCSGHMLDHRSRSFVWSERGEDIDVFAAMNPLSKNKNLQLMLRGNGLPG